MNLRKEFELIRSKYHAEYNKKLEFGDIAKALGKTPSSFSQMVSNGHRYFTHKHFLIISKEFGISTIIRNGTITFELEKK